jgi:hypothetical protein
LHKPRHGNFAPMTADLPLIDDELDLLAELVPLTG